MCGLPATPPADSSIRKKLKEECLRQGLAEMFRRLESVDPASAGRILPGDCYRILRALEVYETCGIPLSRIAPPNAQRRDMNFLVIGLVRPRVELYSRIDSRVEAMFAAGLPGEVKSLLRQGCRETDPGMRGIGYSEFFEALRDGCLRIKDVAEKIKANSRRYAKRQLAFFKSFPDVTWVHPDKENEICRRIEAFLSLENI
jgi:tRNA dimethylallyltransferase